MNGAAFGTGLIFLVLVYFFNFDLFEFSAAILEKGLLISTFYIKKVEKSACIRRI